VLLILEKTEKREFGIGILRGNLLILIVCRCIWMFSTSIPRPYLSLYIRELGGSSAIIGLVNSLASVAGLFLYPMGGYIADSRGRVRLVGLATFGYALSMLPFAFAPSWEWIAAAAFLQGFLLFYGPVLTAIMGDSMPPGQRGLGFALEVGIPGALGILSPYVGGYLVDLWGIGEAMPFLYKIGFGAAVFVAMLRIFTLKETHVVARERVSVSDLPRMLKESYVSVIDTVKWMPRNLKSLTYLSIIHAFFISLAGPFWILFFSDGLGLSASQWGMLTLVAGGVRMVLAIPAGRLMDRYGRRRLMIPMMILTPLIPLWFMYSRGFTDLLILMVIKGSINAFLLPGFMSLVADYTPRERRGRVLAAIGAGRFQLDMRVTRVGGGVLLFIPATIAASVGGVLYEANIMFPFFVLTAGMTLAAILAIRRMREPETIEV
jgi:MFS family permease